MPRPSEYSMKRRRIVRIAILVGALSGIVLPFVLGPRARVLTSAMPGSAAGILTAVVFALFGAGYGWAVGEVLVRLAYRSDESSST